VIGRGIALGARGGLIEARVPGVRLGDGVTIATTPHKTGGHVCALGVDGVLIAAHGALGGVARGMAVWVDPFAQSPPLGACALGRAIDARGRPLDGGPLLRGRRVAIARALPEPAERAPVCVPFWTGVRVIDGLLTVGRGARIGIFGAPGTGKSTLIEAIAAGCRAEAIVIALIGERGREAQRWIDRCTRYATVVCATSDRAPAERVRAAQVAVAHAGALRERGLEVLLVLDSLARVAGALRELAIGAGEPVGRGGYPPSVFAALARLAEASGPVGSGSITLVASVLDDGDDRDPVSDAARSLLDGHVVLNGRLAAAGRFPAVDVLSSASRTMASVASPEHVEAAARVRTGIALLERIDDARRVGIAPAGPDAARAIAAEDGLEVFLRQLEYPASPVDTLAAVRELADRFA
jgi:type III secretion protein N (ATPase)